MLRKSQYPQKVGAVFASVLSIIILFFAINLEWIQCFVWNWHKTIAKLQGFILLGKVAERWILHILLSYFFYGLRSPNKKILASDSVSWWMYVIIVQYHMHKVCHYPIWLLIWKCQTELGYPKHYLTTSLSIVNHLYPCTKLKKGISALTCIRKGNKKRTWNLEHYCFLSMKHCLYTDAWNSF